MLFDLVKQLSPDHSSTLVIERVIE